MKCLFYSYPKWGLEYLAFARTGQYTSIILPLGQVILQYITYFCQDIVQWNFECLNILQKTTMIHYINDITLIKLDEQKWASTLETLLEDMCIRGWKISPIKIQEPAMSIEFLAVWKFRGMTRHASKTKGPTKGCNYCIPHFSHWKRKYNIRRPSVSRGSIFYI